MIKYDMLIFQILIKSEVDIMPIFGRSAGSTKSPSETVKSLLESLTKLGRADVKEKDKERENENVHKMLLHLKVSVDKFLLY